jgi:uncharacterized membrane protein YGL010W
MNKKIASFIATAGVLLLPLVSLAATEAPKIAQAVQKAAVGVGVPLVIVGWLIAGILYLTSAGSPEKTGTAKKALIAAVVGTVLVILSANACEFVKSIFGLDSCPT